MNKMPTDFLVTTEHRRFAEFCDACRRYRYIGLCYGAAGVGKTLSAQHYAHWFGLQAYCRAPLPSAADGAAVAGSTTVFYTPAVVNTPGRIAQDIQIQRHQLRALAIDVWVQEQAAQQKARRQAEAHRRPTKVEVPAVHRGNVVQLYVSTATPSAEIAPTYAQKRLDTPDPTDLIIIDEADRLKTASLEQVRDIFDHGGLGAVFIGMPGIEKRLSRYPQLYSRVGFVHAFRPLSAAQVRDLLQQQWAPAGVTLPAEGIADEEARAAVIRVTGGNFRLLHRLLTQIARLVEINALHTVTSQVVEAARESLVIGTA
jgi:DNA transposition AAA+ family ATPase